MMVVCDGCMQQLSCTIYAWDSALISWPDIRPVLWRAYAGMRDASTLR